MKRTMARVALTVAVCGVFSIVKSGFAIDALPDNEPQSAFVVAFDSYRDGDMEVYVMSADGREQRRLTYNPAFDAFPAVSPDGRKILFQSDRDDDGIYVINMDGTGEKRLIAHGSTPAWSPHGKEIAYTDGDLWVANADGTNPIRVTNTPDVREDCPTFSPDGTRIAFDSVNGRHGIAVINVDGTNRQQITPIVSSSDALERRDDSPVWSPRGDTIIYWSSRHNHKGIYAIAPDGSTEKCLAQDLLSMSNQLSFNSDGTKILFSKYEDDEHYTGTHIWMMNADGTDPQQLTSSESIDADPSWGPRVEVKIVPQTTPGS